MKKLYFLFIAIFALSCSTNEKAYKSYGANGLNKDDVTTVSNLVATVGVDETAFRVKGTVEEVCQMKGCWMTLRNDEGVSIRITFKDYGFFVPKDISGREVILEGVAFKEMLEEDVAKHYADDGGLVYNETMRNQISFVANGVLVAEI